MMVNSTQAFNLSSAKDANDSISTQAILMARQLFAIFLFNAKGANDSISKQDIIMWDTLFGKLLLIVELKGIPEFNDLWAKAKKRMGEEMLAIAPRLKEASEQLSPQVLDAVRARGERLDRYEGEIIEEASEFEKRMRLITREADDRLGASEEANYHTTLEALVQPLGVLGLKEMMTDWDIREWGLYESLGGASIGPRTDQLYFSFFERYTGTSLKDALLMNNNEIVKRARRNTSSIRRHMNTYLLKQRIHFWVRSVIYGESTDTIASKIEANEEYSTEKYPNEWIRKQIREASKTLGVKRRSGRPRKGGVLRQWKLMSE